MCLFVPVINALVITQIHQNAIYRSRSSCALIGNITLSNDASIQSCIWSCINEYDCQTAVYFKNENICLMYSELCEQGSIESSGNISANVICYRKSHRNNPFEHVKLKNKLFFVFRTSYCMFFYSDNKRSRGNIADANRNDE
jgi:hypothetical protein